MEENSFSKVSGDSKVSHNSFFEKKMHFVYLKGKSYKSRGGDREIEVFHLLFHASNEHNIHGWTSDGKPGGASSRSST